MKVADLPRRERNAATTRVALVRALLPKLRDRRFEEVPVKELCGEVGITEPTFFNHFFSKDALLLHYISLWSLAAAVRIRTGAGAQSGVARLLALFDEVATGMRQDPGVLPTIIAHYMRLRTPPPAVHISQAERLLWHGDNTVLAEAPVTVPELIAECVALAHQSNELPRSVDRRQLRAIILALFFGIPAAELSDRKLQATFRGAVTAVLQGHGAAMSS